jgi:hypothetical protein
MPLTFVSAAHSPTTFLGQVAKSVTAGSHLWLASVVALSGDVEATGATDDQSNVWTRHAAGNSTNRHLAIFKTIASATGTLNVQLQVSGSIGSVFLELAEFTGLLAESPFDVASTVATGTGTTLTSNSATPSQAESFLFGLGGVDFTGTVFTPDDPPWTNRTANPGERCHIASREVSSIAAYTLTGTLSASEAWGAIFAAYKYPVATGGPLVQGGATAGHRRNRLAA